MSMHRVVIAVVCMFSRLLLLCCHRPREIEPLANKVTVNALICLSQECGPTICGDEFTDPEIMSSLECKLIQQPGNNL